MAFLTVGCACRSTREGHVPSHPKTGAVQPKEKAKVNPQLPEMPAPLKKMPEQILYRKGFTVSYNKETLQANWVAWRLTAEHVRGKVKRPSGNAWHEDTEVPYPRATRDDYKGSGYSRGHLCPAADCKWDEEVMYESFLLTNCSPQNLTLNSGDWNEMEIACRRWAEKYGEVYIVTGPLFYRQEHQTVGDSKIAVPEAFFKVVLCLNGTPKGIGFVCKNTSDNRTKDFYVNTIAQVERLTGMQFFPQLPPKTAKQVKEHADIHEW